MSNLCFSKPESIFSTSGGQLYIDQGSTAASNEARNLDRWSNIKVIFKNTNLNSNKNKIYEDLNSEWRSHTDGWDGPHSKAFSHETLAQAKKLVDLLPIDIELLPTVFSSNDGGVYLEWEKDNIDLTLLIKGKKIVYSSISDESRKKGMFVLKDNLSDILPIIKSVAFN